MSRGHDTRVPSGCQMKTSSSTPIPSPDAGFFHSSNVVFDSFHGFNHSRRLIDQPLIKPLDVVNVIEGEGSTILSGLTIHHMPHAKEEKSVRMQK